MTFPTCLFKKPLRCWQYHAKDGDDSPMPTWVAKAIEIDGSKVTYDYPGGEWTFDDGDWLVEFDRGTEHVDSIFGVFNNAQFEVRFDIIENAGPSAGTTAQI